LILLNIFNDTQRRPLPLQLHRHNANFKGKFADATPTAANSPVYAATVTYRCGRVIIRMAMENLAALGGINGVHVLHGNSSTG